MKLVDLLLNYGFKLKIASDINTRNLSGGNLASTVVRVCCCQSRGVIRLLSPSLSRGESPRAPRPLNTPFHVLIRDMSFVARTCHLTPPDIVENEFQTAKEAKVFFLKQITGVFHVWAGLVF